MLLGEIDHRYLEILHRHQRMIASPVDVETWREVQDLLRYVDELHRRIATLELALLRFAVRPES